MQHCRKTCHKNGLPDNICLAMANTGLCTKDVKTMLNNCFKTCNACVKRVRKAVKGNVPLGGRWWGTQMPHHRQPIKATLDCFYVLSEWRPGEDWCKGEMCWSNFKIKTEQGKKFRVTFALKGFLQTPLLYHFCSYRSLGLKFIGAKRLETGRMYTSTRCKMSCNNTRCCLNCFLF